MPKKTEIKKEFWVMYEPTGKSFPNDPPIFPGCHGKFESREKAEEAMEKCLQWFNVRVLEQREFKNGNEIQPERKLTSENVTCWIDEYHEGVLVHEGKKPCEASEEKPERKSKRELATA